MNISGGLYSDESMKYEWRVFWPLDSDDTHEEEDLGSDEEVMEWEERTDIYYFTGNAYGVKRRGEEKEFEVKVLIERKKRGAEKYNKHIVSKNRVREIVPTFYPKTTKSLRVHKRRRVIKIGGVKTEVCYLEANERRWKSLSWEGKAPLVYDTIRVHFDQDDDWTIESILRDLPSGSHVGGYPSWVMTMTADEVKTIELEKPPTAREGAGAASQEGGGSASHEEGRQPAQEGGRDAEEVLKNTSFLGRCLGHYFLPCLS